MLVKEAADDIVETLARALLEPIQRLPVFARYLDVGRVCHTSLYRIQHYSILGAIELQLL